VFVPQESSIMNTLRLGPHYRLFIGRQFSWLLNKYEDLLSAHTKAIVVGRQIDRKQFSLPGGRGSYPIGLNYRPII
jgi:hypothetical protein